MICSYPRRIFVLSANGRDSALSTIRQRVPTWVPFRLPGYICRDTTIAENTKGVAGVQVVRKGQGGPEWASHDTDIHFTFVMDGEGDAGR